MNAKTKKILLIVGIVLDVAITAFLFVISILMIAMLPKQGEPFANNFIGYLQQNTTVYLLSCVVPLFLLLALNITALVWYVKKVANKKVALSDLSEEQKEALRKQLLSEMSKSSEDKKE